MGDILYELPDWDDHVHVIELEDVCYNYRCIECGKTWSRYELCDNPLFRPRLNKSIFQSTMDKPIVSRMSNRYACSYCHQLHKIEDFEGGCRSCGAPAPKMDKNVYGANWRVGF